MTVELIIYTSAVSLLLGLAALAIERAIALTPWPRRWVWAAAMGISLAGSTIMVLGAHAPAAASHGLPTAMRTMPASSGFSFPPLAIPPQPLWRSGPAAVPVRALLEACAKWLWPAASILLLGVYALGALHLMKVRRNWPLRSIGKYQVLVSKDLGPAVFGVIRPAIVMPSWLLEETDATRDAALAHEAQHIAARDPALLLAALLLLALTPWNLPLWWQLRRLRLAIELDCDARVLDSGVERRLYANTLLSISQFAVRMPFGAVAIVGRGSQIERRILAMMSARPRYVSLWILAFSAVALPLLVVAAQLSPPSSAPSAPPAHRSAHMGIGLADFDVNGGAAAVAAARYHGAIVTWVTPGEPAERAGLKRGDLVLRFGETQIINARTLALEVAHTAPDAHVPLVIQRSGMNQRLWVDFSTAPPPRAQSAPQIVDTSDWNKLRDANLPISEPALRDELVRMSRLDEQDALLQVASKMPARPNHSALAIGPRVEPGVSEANVRRLREIIAQHGWPSVSMVGVRGSTAATLIALRASADTEFHAEVLRLMEPLLQRDEVSAMDYAMLYDEVHTPQRFGMVSECIKGELQPSKPLEDPQHLEERRAALGLVKLPQFCDWPKGIKSP